MGFGSGLFPYSNRIFHYDVNWLHFFIFVDMMLIQILIMVSFLVRFTTVPCVLPEVTLSGESFKAAGIKDLDKLFTKDGHLKKAVGQASKGWKLERVKNSTTEDPSKAFLDAKRRLGQLMLESDTSIDNFVFSRRTPCKCLESIAATVGSDTLLQCKFSNGSSFSLIDFELINSY